MIIPDFQQLITQTSQPGQFKLSSEWFIFQRKIISEVYGDFKNLDTFKIYLYLCKHYDMKSKVTRRNKTRITKDLKYAVQSLGGPPVYSNVVQNSLDWLEQEKFIICVSGNKHNVYRSSVLVAPDFHFQKQKFVPCDKFKLKFNELKGHYQGYIMLPQSAITNSALTNTTYARRYWTDRKLKVLLLLYAYCWPEYYGGIDPQTVSVDKQGNLSLSHRFCFALQNSQTAIEKSVISLIKRGYFKPVECVFEDGMYVGDVGTFNQSSHSLTETVLRPTHLIEHVLSSEIMKQKKGFMRI